MMTAFQTSKMDPCIRQIRHKFTYLAEIIPGTKPTFLAKAVKTDRR